MYVYAYMHTCNTKMKLIISPGERQSTLPERQSALPFLSSSVFGVNESSDAEIYKS